MYIKQGGKTIGTSTVASNVTLCCMLVLNKGVFPRTSA